VVVPPHQSINGVTTVSLLSAWLVRQALNSRNKQLQVWWMRLRAGLDKPEVPALAGNGNTTYGELY